MDPAVDPKSNASHPPESESKPNETTTHPPPPPPSDAPPSDPQSTAQMAPETLHHVPDAAQTRSDPQSTAQMKSDYVPDTDQLRSDTQSTAQMYPSISAESNPYVAQAPIQSSSSKNTMETVKGVLSRWGKKVGVATKKAEDLSRNTWQHLRTGPSIADVALGRIAQGSKVIAEGGYDKIFRNTFETLPDENLRKCYACYLSTSAGPVMGVLYISTVKIAFCSDAPLSYKVGDKTEWSYYKVAIPLNQLRGVNPSLSEVNQAEKFIQIISIDSHEFWFMGFVNYDSAVKNLQQVLPQIHSHLQP